jgi:AMMECR1 domain-containing protein
MRVDELPLLHCSVSLLHDFERAATPTDWELGRHGINIEFKDPVSGKRRHATYLPEVIRYFCSTIR